MSPVQLRAHLAGVPRQPAAFGDQRVLSQHPIHRGNRTQIDVLEVLTSDRFVDLAPLQIYAQLLDEGTRRRSASVSLLGRLHRRLGADCGGERRGGGAPPTRGRADQPGQCGSVKYAVFIR